MSLAAVVEMVVVVDDGAEVTQQNENWKWVRKMTSGSQLDTVNRNAWAVGCREQTCAW